MKTEEMKNITFTPEKLRELRTYHSMAKALGQTQFEFEGHTLLVDYAKYLIQYLEMEFGEKQKNGS